jgi:hypothetical protein
MIKKFGVSISKIVQLNEVPVMIENYDFHKKISTV